MQETAQIIFENFCIWQASRGCTSAAEQCGGAALRHMQKSWVHLPKMMICTQYFLESKGFDILHEWTLCANFSSAVRLGGALLSVVPRAARSDVGSFRGVFSSRPG